MYVKQFLSRKFITGFAIVILFSLLYLYMYQTGMIDSLFQSEKLQNSLQRVGYWGPLLIIALMTAAIVMSPIPSAPIAVASGIAYGHAWGTLYVLIGSLAGAIIAFSIARMVGYDVMQKKFGDQIKYKFLNSGRHIMLVVLISRLIPFISFDIVSYAAGLTKISYTQFITATFAGILPASFLLAHFGNAMVDNDGEGIITTVILLGFITLIPILFGLYKNYRHK